MKSASRLVSLLVVFFLLLSQFIPVESQFPGRPGSPGQGNSAAAAAQTVEALDIPPLGDPTTAVTYVQSFGETQVAYFDDPSYLNFPGGIGVTANNQVWIAEFVGKRALLFDYDGVFIKQINRPMMYLGYVLAEIQHLCDVAAAPDGNVWLNFEGTLVKADPDGAYVGELSGGPELSYNCKGLAVDGSGNLFVSDWSTHMITVYDSSGNHIATIGDPAAGDVEFSTPTDMAISGEVMYVSEAGHDRVSILNISDLQNVTYEGEINEYPVDSEMVRFANPQGVGADATRIFVADSGHNLVHIFDRATKTYQNSLSAIVPPLSSTGWNKPYDIELDSAGRIYISDMNNHRVIQFDENLVLQRIFGTLGVAYKTDDKHFNYPSSVATDSLGNFYVSESGAHRVVKLSAAGVPLGSLGETGIIGDDESHFNYPSGLAVDPANKLYVADRHNHRIMVFTSTGVFNRVFGSYGSDENQFNNPTGVAIDSSHIYVVDNGNERVQVFNLDWSYYTTIGVTGEAGVDNEHFDRPMDVAVDGNGNIYISDNGNARLQKCTLSGTSYTCVTLVGESGVKGDPYTHFQNINGVAVGANNLVYMVDHGMCLIYIYDSSGNFRGSLSNNFLLPLDIAIDSNGNMYVADSMNQRIQKLSPVDLGYTQVSVDHFGDPTLQDYPLLVPYAGKLYASYEHPDGTQIWSMAADETWQIISAAVDPANLKFFSGMEFNSKLYLGSYDPVGAADIYRFDGSSWELVASDGLGEVTNHAFSSMVEFNGALYAGTTRSSGSSPLGAQIWRSFNGNLNSWEKVLDFNSINTASAVIQELVVYNGYLYAMVQNYTTGAQVWRSVSGSSGSWEPVMINGFNLGSAGAIHTAEVFSNAIYFGAGGRDLGAQMWRCQACDGTDFTLVIQKGFNEGDVDRDGYYDNARTFDLTVFQGKLFAHTFNRVSGSETWLSSNGTTWQRFKPYGLSFTTRADSVIFNDKLYAGSDSTVVWRLNTSSLPLAPARVPGAPAVVSPIQVSNAIPLVSGFTMFGAPNTDLHFAPGDFGAAFKDADRDILMRLKITSLPEHGTLEMEGEPVEAGQVLAYDDVRRLYYQPEAGFEGQDVFYWIGCDGVAWPVESEPVTLVIGSDGDDDSRPDSLEAGVQGGDGNGDGTADAEQAYVVSLTYTPSRALSSPAGQAVTAYPLYSTSPYATLSISDALAFAHVIPMPYPEGNPPLPEQADFFPTGFFKLYIKGLQPGDAVDVELLLPGSRAPGQFLLYGAEEGDVKFHFHDFALKDGIGAEVEILPDQMLKYTLHFVDGQKGDSDLVDNGFITAVFGVSEAAQHFYLPVVQR